MNNTSAKPRHCPMDQFATAGHQLLVNQVPITQLVDRVGQTPFYAYDRSVIKQNIAQLRAELPGKIKLHYAIKANPMPALIDFIAPLVDGLDVASSAELIHALNSSVAPTQVSFAGPGKRDAELQMALASGIIINIESENELKRVIALSEQSGYRANVALRINPDFELKSSGMKMGGGAQQFGIDAEAVVNILPLLQQPSVNFRGLHIFTGSQNLSAASICEAHRGIFALAAKIKQQLKLDLAHLNIGGGFGIPYFPGETVLDIKPIATELKGLLEQYQSEFATTEVIIELGRFLVGNAGLYVSRVTDIKQSRGETFVIVDGGMHHHLAASGNFGQVIRKNYPVAIANKMNLPTGDNVTITGPLCTPLDLLAKNMSFPQIEVGDIVAIYQSGAYGFTASPREFLSHPQPIEVLV
ncbi:MAG: pyridoxal-dependent decarboxylase, exosortase A system-associated [Gammaproteobacteria bacterium]|nr:pyridoxal-dependent decarboxylase, exosortase A system-associated [Gammaproteobacteria bacterium]